MTYTDSFSRDRDDGSVEVILDDEPKKGDRGERRAEDRGEERREEPVDRRSDRGQADLISGDEGIKRLRSDLDRVSRTATAAEQRAARAEAALETGRQRLEQVEQNVVDTELKGAEEKLVSARAKFKAAFDAADPDAIADAQEEISEASSDLRDLKRKRSETERTEERRGTEGRVDTDLPADPVERFIVSNKMSSRNAEWLRNHPECVTDETRYYEMHAADARARKDNIRPGSDAYYNYMEKELGYVKRGRDDDDRRDDRDERREERRPSERRPAAPPSRDPSGPDGRPSRPSSVRLNADEREMAQLSFPDMKAADAEREYARNKADLLANDPTYRTHERR